MENGADLGTPIVVGALIALVGLFLLVYDKKNRGPVRTWLAIIAIVIGVLIVLVAAFKLRGVIDFLILVCQVVGNVLGFLGDLAWAGARFLENFKNQLPA